MRPLISVIVSTYNRPQQLKACLQSIITGSFSPKKYEIIVIDQSDLPIPLKFIHKSKRLNIRYYHVKSKGLSRSRNIGIQKAKAEIIAFTDDDCIVDKNWLSYIYRSFALNNSIIGIFGRVFSHQVSHHDGQICPITFTYSISRIITIPSYHAVHIGFGNNMAFRKEAFKTYGGFKEWLGVGSIGLSAEDAEFPLRLLISKKALFYNPQIIVHHNRWLTPTEYKKQLLGYTCGELACYSYFAFQGYAFAQNIVSHDFRSLWEEVKYKMKNIFKKREISYKDYIYTLKKFLYIIRGLLIGFTKSWY